MNIVKLWWLRWRYRNQPISIYDQMQRIELAEQIKHGLAFLELLQEAIKNERFEEAGGKIMVHDPMVCSCGFSVAATGEGFTKFSTHECWPSAIMETEKVNV